MQGKRADMAATATLSRILRTCIVPVLLLLSAVYVLLVFAVVIRWYRWINDQPAGVILSIAIPPAIFFPIFDGKLPPIIFGHGFMTGTPPVPDDMVPLPRPNNELFLDLPGGYRMPQAGLGMCCRASAYDDVLVRRTVLWYLLLGGRHLDTAHFYMNHRAIGQGIQDAIQRGVSREEIFVTTKLSPSYYGYNSTLQGVPTYLEELQLDYIDLVLMHFPVGLSLECGPLTYAECRADTYRALSELRIADVDERGMCDTRNNSKKGVIRNIGVSNFAVPDLQHIQGLNLAPIAVNQIQFNPWAQTVSKKTYQYCRAQNISITAYASLGGMPQYVMAQSTEELDFVTLHAIARKHSKSVPQVMLRWALQNHMAIIPGTGNPNHMKENLDVYSFELDATDMVAINTLSDAPFAREFFSMIYNEGNQLTEEGEKRLDEVMWRWKSA